MQECGHRETRPEYDSSRVVLDSAGDARQAARHAPNRYPVPITRFQAAANHPQKKTIKYARRRSVGHPATRQGYPDWSNAEDRSYRAGPGGPVPVPGEAKADPDQNRSGRVEVFDPEWRAEMRYAVHHETSAD